MSRKAKDWTAEDLARQADAAAQLVEYLRDAHEDDDDLINDSIEGETDFLETVDRALEQIAEAEMMVKAIKEREATLAQRRKRFEDKSAFLRNCIEMAMATANGDRDLPFTLLTPGATVTLRAGKAKVIIEDEAKLPAQFWRKPDPVIDRKALNEYIASLSDPNPVVDDETGDPPRMPDGVSLSDAGFSLSVRRK
jgi:hypothetical protein